MHRWCCNVLAKACQQMPRPLPCNTASSTQLTQFSKSSTHMNNPSATCTGGMFSSTQVGLTGHQLRSQHRWAMQQPVTSEMLRHAAQLCKHHTSAARVQGLLKPVGHKQGLHSCVHSFAQSALPAAARHLMTKTAPGPLSHQLRSHFRPALKPRRQGEVPLFLFHIRFESICQSLHSEVTVKD